MFRKLDSVWVFRWNLLSWALSTELVHISGHQHKVKVTLWVTVLVSSPVWGSWQDISCLKFTALTIWGPCLTKARVCSLSAVLVNCQYVQLFTPHFLLQGFRYNGSLVTGTAACLTAAKFKYLIFYTSIDTRSSIYTKHSISHLRELRQTLKTRKRTPHTSGLVPIFIHCFKATVVKIRVLSEGKWSLNRQILFWQCSWL
jgi:hypothetical protein